MHSIMSVHHRETLTVGVIPPVHIATSMVRQLALPHRILIAGVTRQPLIATNTARLLGRLRLTQIVGVIQLLLIAISMGKQSVLHPAILIVLETHRQHTPIHTEGVQARLVHTLIVGETLQQPTETVMARASVLRRATPIRLEPLQPNRIVAIRILLSGRGKIGIMKLN